MSGSIKLDDEVVIYTSKNSTQFLGLTRGAAGTAAATHALGIIVRAPILGIHHETLAAAIIAAQTKLGSGASTPVANSVMMGGAVGSSAWTAQPAIDCSNCINIPAGGLSFTPEDVVNKDTDGTLAANSDTKYPSQKAVKTYADTKQSALGFTPVPNTRTVNGHALNADVTVSKGDVGLGNADNTSDANKPVSTAQQAALDLKVNTSTTVNGHALNANVAITPADLGLVIGTNVEAFDADLLAIAGLSPSNDDIIQLKSGAWTNRTIAQLKTDLSLSGTNTGDQDLSGYVPTTRTVNGKALSSNITLGLASSDFANQGTASSVLHGNAAGNPSFGAVVEGDQSLSDNTTNDFSPSKHGYVPKGTNVGNCLKDDGTWGSCGGGGTTINSTDTVIPYRSSSTTFADTPLFREDADTIAQRHGTTAQTFNLYRTYTSSTNYERLRLTSDANRFYIRMDPGSGGGTDRPLRFLMQGLYGFDIDTGGNVIPINNTTHNLGDTTHQWNKVYSNEIYAGGVLGRYLGWQLTEAGSNGTTSSIFKMTSNSGAGITWSTPPVTPAQITSNQNDYSPGNQAYFVRFSTDASRDITGYSPLTFDNGEVHLFVNVGSQNVVLKHQDTNSTAQNRFLNSTGADITLGPDQAADVIRDNTTNRWRVFKRN